MGESELRFSFGDNWQSYVDRSITPRRVAAAAASLRAMLGVEHLCGRTFLDIGCGSGLFSLAACLLGAEHVCSFDYDIQSVLASEKLRKRAGIDATRWSIRQGSILDDMLLRELQPADIVYSWGVLHHTGSMWQAIDNSAQFVRPGGLFAIAIYNHQQRLVFGSEMWWHIKKFYNQTSAPIRRITEYAYVGMLMGADLLSSRDLLRTIRYYRNDVRGMDFWHDVRDWLGGFPYEYASVAAVVSHVQANHGLELMRSNPSSGAGCNEFTFRSARSR